MVLISPEWLFKLFMVEALLFIMIETSSLVNNQLNKQKKVNTRNCLTFSFEHITSIWDLTSPSWNLNFFPKPTPPSVSSRSVSSNSILSVAFETMVANCQKKKKILMPVPLKYIWNLVCFTTVSLFYYSQSVLRCHHLLPGLLELLEWLPLVSWPPPSPQPMPCFIRCTVAKVILQNKNQKT